MQEILQWSEADVGDHDCLPALHIPMQCKTYMRFLLNKESQIFILLTIS